jgi:AcrR family transcriptional regulator
MQKKVDIKLSVVERKVQIIEEATALFYKNGYDNTSIRELSKAAELSVAGVYYFFKDKEEILFSILNQSIIDLNDTIKTTVRGLCQDKFAIWGLREEN